MSLRCAAGLVVLAGLILGSAAGATEPDGRVAFRYGWPDGPTGAANGAKLRISITAYADLADARLSAELPSAIGLDLAAAGRVSAPWPDAGLELGDLAAGQTVILELRVAKPLRGGGIVGFRLQARASDGRSVREGVGVPVGTVGAEPTLRNGAAEFPVAVPDPAP